MDGATAAVDNASPQYPARWYRDGDAGDSVHLGDLGPRPFTTGDEITVRSTLEVVTATQRLANLEAAETEATLRIFTTRRGPPSRMACRPQTAHGINVIL